MTDKIRRTESSSEAKVVTALGRFLMDTPLETLLAFLHKIGVQYSISGNVPSGVRQGYFRCKIFLRSRVFWSLRSTTTTITRGWGRTGTRRSPSYEPRGMSHRPTG